MAVVPRYRILGPLEVAGEDGPAGWDQAARAPRTAHAQPGPRRSDRHARRPALGRTASSHGAEVAPELRLAATEAARPGNPRHAFARLHARWRVVTGSDDRTVRSY